VRDEDVWVTQTQGSNANALLLSVVSVFCACCLCFVVRKLKKLRARGCFALILPLEKSLLRSCSDTMLLLCRRCECVSIVVSIRFP
jgi:hypothetical protein